MTEQKEKDPYELSLDELADELAEFNPKEKKKEAATPEDERIIAGFEDIERFFEKKGRLPASASSDIFERLLAIRLEAIKNQPKCMDLLDGRDEKGLLTMKAPIEVSAEDMSDDELADFLEEDHSGDDLFDMKHVRTFEERADPDFIAERKPCKDFDRFKRLFAAVDFDLKQGVRQYYSLEGGENKKIAVGEFYVLNGQVAYIAAVGDVFMNAQNRPNARMRVIFSNGTESSPLVRSFQRAMYGDTSARGITDPKLDGLFAEAPQNFEENGTIYVLRSKSDIPFIAEHRDLVHKIGVTTTPVETRIANAANDPTYLLADVEVVAAYKLYGIDPTKLENLIHKIFESVRIDFDIKERFGKVVRPREWFLVPLSVIDELIGRIQKGDLEGIRYDSKRACLVGGSSEGMSL